MRGFIGTLRRWSAFALSALLASAGCGFQGVAEQIRQDRQMDHVRTCKEVKTESEKGGVKTQATETECVDTRRKR
jgi:hypothetical protein